MNILLSLLLTTQKPKLSQPPISQGWEIALIMGAFVGTAILKYGVQDKKSELKTYQSQKEIEPRQNFQSTQVQTERIQSHNLNNHNSIVDTPDSQINTDYLGIGQRIIDELVSTKLSTLFAAPSGAGKSVTQAYWLTKLFEKYPQADVYVIAQKNDSFNGLSAHDRVWLFDSENPTEALEALRTVHDIGKKRSRLPEGAEREKLKSLPVRLILADWYSIHNTLTKCHKKLWESEQTKLADIVTVFREFNVSLFADTQSFNIASLGLASDSNIRNNLNIISQGLISYDDEGNEQGGFEVVQSIVKNDYIFPDSQLRERLINEVNKHVKLSTQTKVPLIISTSGKPKVGLLPNLLEFKGKKILAPQNKVSIVQPGLETTAITASEVLTPDLRVVWKAAQEKQDWLTVRDIVRNQYSALKGMTSEDVTKLVEKLGSLGLLELSYSQGTAVRFKAKHTST